MMTTMMDRPKIKIEKDGNDLLLEFIGFLGLIALFAIPSYYYGQLPDQIPIHFNAEGIADRYGDKMMIWLLPVLGSVVYITIYLLNGYPHLFNLPVKITPENVEPLYRSATKMMRLLNVVILIFMVYIGYSTINTALGVGNGLGQWFTPVFLISIAGILGYSIYRMSKF